MATNRFAKKDTNNTQEAAPAFDHGLSVIRAMQFNDGGIVFDLLVDDIKMYGLRIQSNKKGEAFVAFPSRKGKDGKWYTHCWMPLTDAQVEAIMDEIEQKLQENSKKGDKF